MSFDCDVIVVGGGAGGGTLAYACARAGKSVLLVERGQESRGARRPVAVAERATLIDKKPYDDRQVDVNGLPKRLYMGGVLGGGTSLYGGALLRPSRDDFHPGRHYGRRISRAIWDWPIAYDDLKPYYQQAEQLYGVAGNAAEDFGPLEKPGDTLHGYPNDPLPLHPINRQLIASSRANGLSPFRLPLAIDPGKCLRCEACAGYVCPTGARKSSAQLLEQAAMEGLPLATLTDVEVERLELSDGAAVVQLRDRATGRRTVYRARKCVLAAGAIGSPLLLQRSGVDGPLVGRHYMMHLSPVALGIFRRPTGADQSFVKQVGFADFYFGAEGYRHKMGLVQSLPVPGPLLTAKMAPRLMPRKVLGLLRQRMLPLAGIIEDLPNPANRVTWGKNGRPRLRHRFAGYDLERGHRLARLMGHILCRAGALFSIKRFASDEHVAHQCGTLRFGKDPAHAVLSPDCRVFKHPNVFVVDASFLPTSLGVGPALTIIANALRVASLLIGEL
jgi:choline dehydrogenase-like flavoprotein